MRLSVDDLSRAGAKPGSLPAGSYTWTFAGTRARLEIAHDGRRDACSAEASAVPAGVVLTYLENLGCGGWTDTISWTLGPDGLHLRLVESSAPREQDAPYLEAKPWQPVEPQPIPSWPTWSARCEPGCQGPLTTPMFVSAGFLPGLGLTFAAGDPWFNSRDDQDELEFDLGETALRFWRNPAAVSPSGERLQDIGTNEAALTRWFVGNGNMTVSSPLKVELGSGLSATTFTMSVSTTNVNVLPDCPTSTRSCLNVLWIAEGHVFSIGFGSAERIYVFTLPGGDVIVASVDAADPATLAALDPRIKDLLTALRLPGSA